MTSDAAQIHLQTLDVINPCLPCLKVTGEKRGRYPRRYAQAVARESGDWITAERCPYWENTWHLKFPPGWSQLVAVQVAQALQRAEGDPGG